MAQDREVTADALGVPGHRRLETCKRVKSVCGGTSGNWRPQGQGGMGQETKGGVTTACAGVSGSARDPKMCLVSVTFARCLMHTYVHNGSRDGCMIAAYSASWWAWVVVYFGPCWYLWAHFCLGYPFWAAQWHALLAKWDSTIGPGRQIGKNCPRRTLSSVVAPC